MGWLTIKEMKTSFQNFLFFYRHVITQLVLPKTTHLIKFVLDFSHGFSLDLTDRTKSTLLVRELERISCLTLIHYETSTELELITKNSSL
jgi:hypothetical protein